MTAITRWRAVRQLRKDLSRPPAELVAVDRMEHVWSSCHFTWPHSDPCCSPFLCPMGNMGRDHQ